MSYKNIATLTSAQQAAGVTGVAGVKSDGSLIGPSGAPVSGAWGAIPYPAGVAAQARGQNALQATALSASRPVDFVMFGDSNQQYNGYGFTSGIEKYLTGLYGCYASPIIVGGGTGAYGGIGYQSTSRLNSDMAVNSGGDVTLQKLFSAGVGQAAMAWGQLAAAASVGYTGGIVLGVGHPIDVTKALDLYLCYGEAPSYSGGSFQPRMRLQNTPYTQVFQGSSVSTTGSFARRVLYKASIAADAARSGNGLEAGWSAPGGPAAVGPLTTYYSRIARQTITSGISCHTLYTVAGNSAWDMAYSMWATPDDSLTTFYSEVRRLQLQAGFAPIVVNYINTGLNDRNEASSPSLGPLQSMAPTSPAAYVDNLRAVQNRIKQIWTKNGWDLQELYWLFVPSHRIADPDDAQLVSYRAAIAAATAVEAQTSVVDLGAKMTQAQGTANGWYGAGQNFIHLTNSGYDGVAALIFS